MTHKTLWFTLLFALPLPLLVSAACSKKQTEPVMTGGYQVGTPGAAGGAGVSGAGGAAGVGTVAAAGAPAVSPPVPTSDPALLGPTLQPMITQLASTQVVAGSKPLGSVIVGNVGGAGTLEQQIMLQSGKCYSAVAIGMAPISELNVQFVAVTIVPGMAPVLATDQDTGASAVLGKKPNCYKWALPLPVAVRVVVTAAGGQGVAAAQVFEK